VQERQEEPSERYFAPAELEYLMRAPVDYPDEQAANPTIMAWLTSARRSEVVEAQWTQLDLTKGVWIKPSAHTKEKRRHQARMLPQALELLMTMCASAPNDGVHMFHGDVNGQPRENLLRPWEAIRKAARLEDVRFHGLRQARSRGAQDCRALVHGC